MNKKNISALLGAAFLMATSSIGPGFLTQTSVFTEQYGADFAFIILISIILTVGAQLNVWRVIGVANMRAQDIANKLLPGLGYFVAFIVALGGLAFNIGNVGGAALGLNVLFNLDLKIGAVITAAICIYVFLSKEAGKAMDKLTVVLGGIMIMVVAYVAIITKPPVTLALKRSIMPKKVDFFPIITLLGGTVGGYITFSGGHRLIDAGITGKENVGEITKSSSLGIAVSSLMRVFLFLAVLGVVYAGNKLDPSNPPASAFKIAAGNLGYKFFGIVIASAAITSVVGAAYTSVSFLRTLFVNIDKNHEKWIVGFILVSTIIFITIGQPIKLLILAGSVNGLILPITLAIILIASLNKDIMGDYKHPKWLLILGVIVVIISAYTGIKSLSGIKNLFV